MNNIKEKVKDKKSLWKVFLQAKNTQRKEEAYKRYKIQKKRVKQLVQDAKQENWNRSGEKMENNFEGNQKLFYRVLKSMRKSKDCPLKNKNEDVLTRPDCITERWWENFSTLLHNDNPYIIEPEPL